MNNVVRQLVYFSPFVFPLYFFRMEFFGIPFTFLEVYVYFTFLVWLLGLRKTGFSLKRPLLFYYSAAVLLFLGVSFGILAAPAFIGLPDGSMLNAQQTALGVWKGWIVMPLFYFVVLTQSLNDSHQVEFLLRRYVYSAVLVGLLAHLLAIFGDGLTYDFRLAGFYESANYLALYILPAITLNCVWFMRRRAFSRLQNGIDVATLVILFYVLFFTKSYAAILALFGTFFLYAVTVMVRHRQQSKKAFAGVVALVAIFVLIVASQVHSLKFKQFLDTENRSSTTVRFEIYQIGWHLIKTHPLLGVGPGLFQANYQVSARDVLGHDPMEWNVPHPHNIFFAFWLNAGVLGLLSFLLLFVLAHYRFTYPLLAFWSVVLHGFFDTPFWKNDLAMVFWLIVGAILLSQLNQKGNAQK
ncbi:MAG: O-antigen ligase family protein [Candidatus Peregrinibacteria bacterium]